MNYLDLSSALFAQDQGSEFKERSVFVADEEGFVHVITDVVYDTDDGCFYIRTKFKTTKNGNGASDH